MAVVSLAVAAGALVPQHVVLLDHGSKRPEAHRALADAARSLHLLTQRPVHPASLKFANLLQPPQNQLNENCSPPPNSLQLTLRKIAEKGDSRVAIVPLFLAPNDGLQAAVDEHLGKLTSEGLSLQVMVGKSLVDDNTPDDNGVASAMVSNILDIAREKKISEPLKVVVLDHGTPSRRVNAVRELLTRQVSELLGSRAAVVAGASMERREESVYDFNEPLLERVFDSQGLCSGDVIIALGFMLPGRHAGPGGDIEEILRAVKLQRPSLRLHVLPLLGTMPSIHKLLRDRVKRLCDD